MNLRSNDINSKTRGAKRKKDDQDSFSTPPKLPKKQETSRFGFYDMSADNSTSFIDKKGSQVNIKTTMVLNTDNLKNMGSLKKKLIPQILKDECKTIDSHTPLKEIFCSPNGSLEGGVTISGTRMTVRDRLGLVTILDNRNPVTPEKSPPLKKNFENDPLVKGIVSPPPDSEKVMTYTVTSQTLSRVEKEKRKSKRRIISQNKAMAKPGISEKKASVTLYGEACQIRTPKKYHQKKKRKEMNEDELNWCHLKPYSFGGGNTQKSENLVAGSSAINRLQILLDGQTRRLVKEHKYNKAKCKISVPVKKGTHIATGTLEQEVTTDSFETLYQLPTTKKHKPLLVTRYYLEKTIDAIVAADKNTLQKTPTKDLSIITFSKFSNKMSANKPLDNNTKKSLKF